MLVKRPKKNPSSLLDLLAVFVAASLCTTWLWIFAERFAVGATWSGINQNGGGPGFLLLLSAGSSSFFLRSARARSLSTIAGTAHAAVAAALCGAVFYYVASWLLPSLPDDAIPPLMSGVIGSFFVPRVVVSVLDESWQRAEVARVKRINA